MRARLVEAAVRAIAARGPDDILIDDVIAEAGVARGTFYKYFDTLSALFAEARESVGNEVLGIVLAARRPLPDPDEALAEDILRFVGAARRYPMVGLFLARIGLRGMGPGTVTHDLIPDYLEQGMADGCFCAMPFDLAVDFIQVCVLTLLRREVAGQTGQRADVIAAILRLLGVAPDRAARIADRQVPPVDAPADSLIARLHAPQPA